MKKQLSLLSLLILAGGAQAADVADVGKKVAGAYPASQPVLVIAPGAAMNISGRPGGTVVKVTGEDQCPNDWLDNLVSYPDRKGCITLDKPAVKVHYIVDGKPVTEVWQVMKQGDRTSILRPDGSQVSQVK